MCPSNLEAHPPSVAPNSATRCPCLEALRAFQSVCLFRIGALGKNRFAAACCSKVGGRGDYRMALRLQLIVEGHLFPENWALFMDRGILRSLGRGAFFFLDM